MIGIYNLPAGTLCLFDPRAGTVRRTPLLFGEAVPRRSKPGSGKKLPSCRFQRAETGSTGHGTPCCHKPLHVSLGTHRHNHRCTRRNICYRMQPTRIHTTPYTIPSCCHVHWHGGYIHMHVSYIMVIFLRTHTFARLMIYYHSPPHRHTRRRSGRRRHPEIWRCRLIWPGWHHNLLTCISNDHPMVFIALAITRHTRINIHSNSHLRSSSWMGVQVQATSGVQPFTTSRPSHRARGASCYYH